MTGQIALDVKCVNFLKDNPRVYALKAARKKIALIGLDATNRHSSDVRLVLGSAQLIAAGKSFPVERRAVILRKLSPFTWDSI